MQRSGCITQIGIRRLPAASGSRSVTAVSRTSRGQAHRRIDEVDHPVDAISVGERDDTRVWGVVVDVRGAHTPDSRPAARRADRALPSKSMSLLVSGSPITGSSDQASRKRIQKDTAWPPTRTIRRSELNGSSRARTRWTSSWRSAGLAATRPRSAQRSRRSQIGTRRPCKRREDLVLLAHLVGRLPAGRDRPRVRAP